jgi:hypothetical protein
MHGLFKLLQYFCTITYKPHAKSSIVAWEVYMMELLGNLDRTLK